MLANTAPMSVHNPITIPPRTSSIPSTSLSLSQQAHSNSPSQSSPPPPTTQVLPNVPEGDWISPNRNRLSGHVSPSGETHKRHSKRASQQLPTRNETNPATPVMWNTEKEKIVLGPYDYMLDHPGKDIRKQFIAAFNQWLKVPEQSLDIITKVVGMLHTSSLLVDDVEDSSVLRRGVPVAHHIFGTAQTINSANYVYFLALQEIQKLSNPVASINVYVTELLNLHRGQGMDLYWRDTLTCPSEDDYLEMVSNKTGGLFRLAIKLMQAESPTLDQSCQPGSTTTITPPSSFSTADNNDCTHLVNQMSLIFQICDDYLNLASTTYTANKGLCEDLTEGKFSFPVIHAIRANPANLQLVNILRQKTQSDEVKKYAVSYMEACGSFEYTRNTIRALRDEAMAEIERVDGGRGLGFGVRKILDKMVEATIGTEESQNVIGAVMREEKKRVKAEKGDGVVA